MDPQPSPIFIFNTLHYASFQELFFFQPGDLPPILGCDCQLNILTWLLASSNSQEGAQIPFLPFPNLLFLQSSLFQLMATLFFQSFGAKP